MLLVSLAFRNGPAADTPMILIVEDHSDTRAMYVEFLRHYYRVEEAATAAEALDIARRRPPALLVTDLSLPGMDGLDLIEALRREGLDHVRTICLSGYGRHLHEERARRVGCDLMLVKPCLPDVLVEHVGAVLKEGAPGS